MNSRMIDNKENQLRLYHILIQVSVLSLMLLASISIALSEEVIQIGNTKPTVEIIYNESIDTPSIIYTLNDSNTNYNNLFGSPQFNSSDTRVKLQLLQDLTVGKYTFSIKACDKVGNCNQDPISKNFEIQISDLNITLVQPRFGLFRTVSGNVTISTNRETRCRYGLENKTFDAYTDPGLNFFTNDDTFSFSHSVYDFKYVDNSVFFVCKDKYGKTVSTYFDFNFDSSIPYLKVRADNVYSPPIQSKIYVESLNNFVQCKYSKSESGFDEMTGFTGYNLDNEEKYSTSHEQVITAYDLKDKSTNRFYVQCITKSGVLSERKYVDIIVDTEKGLVIDIIDPDYYINKSYFKLNVSTSVAATCFYKLEDEDNYDNSLVRDDSMKHHASSGNINYDEGKHTIYVKCTDMSNVKMREESKEFIIDLTRPVIRNVRITTGDDNSKVNSTTVTVTAEAEEGNDGSGINRYEYMVYNDDPYTSAQNLTDWRYAASRSNKVQFSVTYPFVNDSSYYVKVRAIDNAGWTSDDTAGKSNTVKYSVRGYNNQGTTCFDIVNKCAGLCNKCSVGGSCNSNTDCVSNFCFLGKCSTANCSDTVKNGDETDTDCGGSCSKCGIDRDCLMDADCESGSCNSKRCSGEDSCRNSMLDPGETDIDCGGRCEQCEVGMSCEIDSDCITNYCKIGEVNNKCFKESKDTDGDSIIDEDDNCQDEPNEDQADLDKDKIGDACDMDKDGDGMSNEWEEANGLDPMNPDDAEDDTDGDKLTNFQEYSNNPKTNPNKKDSDEDGYSDYDEINKYHTNPMDANSRPRSIIMLLIVWSIFTLLAFLSGYYLFYSKKSASNNVNKNITTSKTQMQQGTIPTNQNNSMQMANIQMPNMNTQRKIIRNVPDRQSQPKITGIKPNQQSNVRLASKAAQDTINKTSPKTGIYQRPIDVHRVEKKESVLSPESVQGSTDSKYVENPQEPDYSKSTDAIERLRSLIRAKRSKVEAMNNELGRKSKDDKSDEETIDKLKSIAEKKKSNKNKKK